MTRRDTSWDNETDPLKGPKEDTVFLRSNYKLMQIGSIFRTPKARFTPKQIHDGAKKAGFTVEIEDESPWWKITAVGKAKPAPPTPKRPTEYTGAGKVYPDIFA